MEMKRILLCLLAVAFLGSSAQSAQIKLGGLSINPYVFTEGKYDDNIYLVNAAAKDSWINRSAIGAAFSQQLESRLSLKADYRFENLAYSEKPEINNAVHHVGALALDMQLPKNMSLFIGENYEYTTDQATSELNARAKRMKNAAMAKFEAPIQGNFGFGADVQHVVNDYTADVNKTLDRTDLLFGGGIRYKLQPKTQLVVNYRYGALDYKNPDGTTNQKNDTTYQNVEAGVEGRITSKIGGEIKANNNFRHYKYAVTGTKRDPSTLGYGVALKYAADETTLIKLMAKREAFETTAGVNRFYRSTLTDLQVTKKSNKFTFGIGGSFEKLDYPEIIAGQTKKRSDDLSTFRFNADYDIQKWLKANAGYSYRIRESNLSSLGYDYEDNTVLVGLKAMF